MAVIGEYTRHPGLLVSKCGEEHGRFYDRHGSYIREGVDPRNYFGRFVGHKYQAINPDWSDMCVCGESQYSHRDIINA